MFKSGKEWKSGGLFKRVFKSKKGEEGDVLKVVAGLLILIVSAGIILLMLGIFKTEGDVKAAENTCHGSVLARTKIGGVTGVKLGPLQCSTQDVEIGGSRTEIKEQIARSMARCWWMFNEGRDVDTFDKAEDFHKALGWEDNDNKCFVCYTLDVDQKSIDGGEIAPPELLEYLSTKDHYQIKGTKYLDYIQSYGGPGAVALIDAVRPKELYSVVYLSKGKDDSSWTTLDTVAAGAATVGGFAVKACVTIVACPKALIVAGAAGAIYVAAHYLNDATEFLYGKDEERAVSIITFDNLRSSETQGCAVMKG